MNYLRSFGTARRPAFAVVALVLVGIGLVLSGGAATSHAASSSDIRVTAWRVLNDPLNANILGQPSPGGNVGYDLTVTNNGTSTANHVVLTESIGTGGQIALIARQTGISCSGSTTLTCQLKQLPSGGTFRVIVIFKTPTAPASSTLTNTVLGSFDPQTTGPPNKRESDTFGPCQDGLDTSCSTTNGVDAVTRTYAGLNTNGTVDQSFSESLALATDVLSVQGASGQKGKVTLPSGFVNNNPDLGNSVNKYVGTTLSTVEGDPGCATCLVFRTDVTMPLASTFGTTGPFWDGATSEAFEVEITIPAAILPNGFKPTGLWHAAGPTGTAQQIQPCSYDATTGAAQPQLTGGLCVASLVLDKKKKVLDAAVWALTNGSYWIG